MTEYIKGIAAILEITYSPDDHGYYGEVWDTRAWNRIYTTPILRSQQSVVRHARAWQAKRDMEKVGEECRKYTERQVRG